LGEKSGEKSASSKDLTTSGSSPLPAVDGDEKFELRASPEGFFFTPFCYVFLFCVTDCLLEDLKKTIAYVRNLTVQFVRKCRVEHLKQGWHTRGIFFFFFFANVGAGCVVQWVMKPSSSSSTAKVSRPTMVKSRTKRKLRVLILCLFRQIAPLQKSSSMPQITVVLSEERVFVRLAKNEQELEWGVSKTVRDIFLFSFFLNLIAFLKAGVVPPLPNSISLALFSDVVCGSNCPMLKNASAKNKVFFLLLFSVCLTMVNAKDTEEFRDKCIELIAANNANASDPKTRACFYVDDMLNFALLVDGKEGVEKSKVELLDPDFCCMQGLKTLFGKPMLMANEDIRALVAAQMTKRMFDLEGVVFDPSSPPSVPSSKPPNYDFLSK
jgi:hypothetical protein